MGARVGAAVEGGAEEGTALGRAQNTVSDSVVTLYSARWVLGTPGSVCKLCGLTALLYTWN